MRLGYSFRAMGTEVFIEPENGGSFFAAREQINKLENLWSRFIPESEVSRLNAGERVSVSPETKTLLSFALRAWVLTEGLFNPTILPALLACGSPAKGAPIRADARVAIDPTELERALKQDAVKLPCGITIDPGAFGKGLASDMVLDRSVKRGFVSIGGDVAYAGETRTTPVVFPFGGERVGSLSFTRGALATSSVASGRWDGGHHVISPATLKPAESSLLQVTVASTSCGWAEVYATACLIAGSLEPATSSGLAAMAVTSDLSIIKNSLWQEEDTLKIGDGDA